MLAEDPADLAARYTAAATALHGTPVRGLPLTVALLDAALLLHVLEDPLPKLLDITRDKALGHLKNLITSRNQSVLAHGTATVTAKLSGNLENFALRTLRAFWALEFDQENVDERIAALQFVVDV